MFGIQLGERAAVPIPPPPEAEWYHGRLDRYSAEQRLKTAYKLGSYLGKNIINNNARIILIFSPSLFLHLNVRPLGVNISEGKRPKAGKLCAELFRQDRNQSLPVGRC